MCGRMTTTTKVEDIAEQFDVEVITDDAAERPPSYNVAPTQQVLVVAEHHGERRLETMRWGLVPFFAKDVSIGNRMINARAEAIPDKPVFRRAFIKRRCILPVDGYYEWQKLDKKKKQPWFFHSDDGSLLGLAGLWEVWHDPQLPEDADPLITVTIITTSANKDMEPVHDRMPLTIAPRDIKEWLDPTNDDTDDLRRLLQPPTPGTLKSYRISERVSSVANDDADLVQPVKEEATSDDEPATLFH
jgi:putative SOS response-associated peptidase YedK